MAWAYVSMPESKYAPHPFDVELAAVESDLYSKAWVDGDRFAQDWETGAYYVEGPYTSWPRYAKEGVLREPWAGCTKTLVSVLGSAS